MLASWRETTNWAVRIPRANLVVAGSWSSKRSPGRSMLGVGMAFNTCWILSNHKLSQFTFLPFLLLQPRWQNSWIWCWQVWQIYARHTLLASTPEIQGTLTKENKMIPNNYKASALRNHSEERRFYHVPKSTYRQRASMEGRTSRVHAGATSGPECRVYKHLESRIRWNKSIIHQKLKWLGRLILWQVHKLRNPKPSKIRLRKPSNVVISLAPLFVLMSYDLEGHPRLEKALATDFEAENTSKQYHSGLPSKQFPSKKIKNKVLHSRSRYYLRFLPKGWMKVRPSELAANSNQLSKSFTAEYQACSGTVLDWSRGTAEDAWAANIYIYAWTHVFQ